MIVRFVSALAEIAPAQWQALTGADNPFLSYQWLDLLECSGSVGGDSGWQPQHLCVFDGEQLLAAMPLYIKNHSYGEYVFDQSLAQAYQANGLSYYPKLVSCIPFTPVQGRRLLLHPACDEQLAAAITAQVLTALQHRCATDNLSGAHLLFVEQTALLTGAASECDAAVQWAQREGTQFHWFNRGYTNFDDFLARCNSKRRKEIRRERRIAQASGLQIMRVTGQQITPAIWLACLRCYQLTNLQYNRHFGYLTPEAFQLWREQIPESLMVTIAVKAEADCAKIDAIAADDIVASAVFMFSNTQLYGRYWGTFGDYPALHFELCYYQGIEFCIERQLQQFDPGAQGEHKVPRGFEPITTRSLHWLKQADFQRALLEFVREEAQSYTLYRQQLQNKLPFRNNE